MENRYLPWWQLVVVAVVAVGLGVLEQIDPLRGASPDFVGVVIALGAFGAMLAWIHVNGGLFDSPSPTETGARQEFAKASRAAVPNKPDDQYRSDDSAPFAQPWSPPIGIARMTLPEHRQK